MHSAIAEVGVLFATSNVHQGWSEPGDDGLIEYSETLLGAHAFAVVGYDKHGFWIQNSWGEEWGYQGFACISYDDWLQNATDVWVARLGAPIELKKSSSTAVAHSASAGQSAAYSYPDLRPHIISLGNNGEFKAGGNYGTSPEEVAQLFKTELPKAIDSAGYKHIVLYAHGGLVSENSAVQRLADYRPTMLSSGIYPFTFIWHSDYWTTVKNVLDDAFSRRRPEGALDAAKDFMLDRLDDALEPLARVLSGKAAWDEMKENALGATQNTKGGARAVVGHLEAADREAAGRSRCRRFIWSVTVPAASSMRRWSPRSTTRASTSSRARFGRRPARSSCSSSTICRRSRRSASSGSRCSRCPISPSRTTTAPTSITSRCSIWSRTRSRTSRAFRCSATVCPSSAWRSICARMRS